MAGLGKRLEQSGYREPKPLVKVLNKMIVQWAIKTLPLEGNFIFCCKKEHIEKYGLDKKLKNILPDCSIISVNYNTRGTAETVLEARHLIDNEDELIISDSDHYIRWDIEQFTKNVRNQNVDACVFVFPNEQSSRHLSYVKLDEEGFVVESAEKIPISKVAVAGIHYYKKGSDFVKYATKMISKNIRFNNEFYVTPVYNEFVSEGKKIITYPIIKKWALGSPEEIQYFLNNPPTINQH